MITEVSIRSQKNRKVGIRCIPAYTPNIIIIIIIKGIYIAQVRN